MLTRRRLFHAGLVTGCAACAALTAKRLFAASATDALAPSKIEGPGYALWYLGSQRQTIMTGDRAAHLNLLTLKGRPHLYGIGPIQGLTGEVTIADSRPSLARVGDDHLVHVTESYEAGVPFFVWAEVSAWQTKELPEDVGTYPELEKFVGEAGATAGLTQAFPFVLTGRPELIDFHIVNATPDTPPGMADHQPGRDVCRLLVEPASGGLHAHGHQYARPFSDAGQQNFRPCAGSQAGAGHETGFT
jgi:hypothetical protein